MSSSAAIRKLKKEYASLESDPPYSGLIVCPLETNLLHAHFLLSGHVFYDTPYEGGVYHGVLKFTKDYPFKPPSILIYTPSGRFKVNERICFSMSDFHPETWSPTWTIRAILHGFVSFMNAEEITTGGISAPAQTRAGYAEKSLQHCVADKIANQLFGSFLQSTQNTRLSLGSMWPPPRPKIDTNPLPVEDPVSQARSGCSVDSAGQSDGGKNSARNKKKREKEKKKKIEAKFWSMLLDQVPSFVESISRELRTMGVDVSGLRSDHVCYRTDSQDQYGSIVGALRSSSEKFTLLVESKVGGRQIATFKLATPIKSTSGDHSVDVIEIPSPKEGRPYPAGLEHVEFALGGDKMLASSIAGEEHQMGLMSWMDRHPSIDWDTRALNKMTNPDVSLKLDFSTLGKVSVKFHMLPLEAVIRKELVG